MAPVSRGSVWEKERERVALKYTAWSWHRAGGQQVVDIVVDIIIIIIHQIL